MTELPELTVVEIEKEKPVIKKATPGEWTREELEESARRCNSHDDLLAACQDARTLCKEMCKSGYNPEHKRVGGILEAAISKAQP